jgi:hypothetical protein
MNFFIGLLFICFVKADVPVGSSLLKLVNNAGSSIEIFWVNIFEAGNPLVKQTEKPIRNTTKSEVRMLFF